MPQFDRIHFLTQIFCISLSLIGIYFLIIRFYPSFYFVPGKIRKKLILLREKSISFINLHFPMKTYWKMLLSRLNKFNDDTKYLKCILKELDKPINHFVFLLKELDKMINSFEFLLKEIDKMVNSLKWIEYFLLLLFLFLLFFFVISDIITVFK